MKQTLILFFAILSISTISNAQRTIKKLDVKEEGISLKVSFQPVIDKIESNGVSIKVTPISTDEVNEEFNQSNLLDGKFNYSRYNKSINAYFLKKKRKLGEKTDMEYLLDGLEWLDDNDKISEEEYNLLSRSIVSKFIPEFKEPSEAETLVLNNPYLIGGTYMSLFRIELVNSTNLVTRFNESILIKSGKNTLTNLSSQFLKTSLEQSGDINLNRSLTLERYNLTTPLLLLPNSTTVKYFASLPCDLTSEKLEISITNFNQGMSWGTQIARNEIDKKYSFFEFVLKLVNEQFEGLNGSHFYLMNQETLGHVYLEDKRIFIDSETIEKPIEVFAYSLSNDNLYFSRNTIVGNRYLDLEKKKRSKIEIKMKKIDDIKRRTK